MIVVFRGTENMRLKVILLCALLSIGAGASFDFPGSDDSINCGTAASLASLDEFSVFAWTYWDSRGVGSYGTVASTGDSGGGWWFQSDGADTDECLSFFQRYGGADLAAYSEATFFPALATWTHIGFSKPAGDSASAVNFWKDFVVDADGSDCSTEVDGGSTPSNDGGNDLRFGSDEAGTGDEFNGKIAHVHIYTADVTDADIIQEIAYRPGQVRDVDGDGTDDLLLYWAGAGSASLETSGNDHICAVGGDTADDPDGPTVQLSGGSH